MDFTKGKHSLLCLKLVRVCTIEYTRIYVSLFHCKSQIKCDQSTALECERDIDSQGPALQTTIYRASGSFVCCISIIEIAKLNK